MNDNIPAAIKVCLFCCLLIICHFNTDCYDRGYFHCIGNCSINVCVCVNIMLLAPLAGEEFQMTKFDEL